MKRVQKIAPITSLQPPYSMLRRDIEAEILPFCEAHNIGVINYSPMASGLLSGKMTAERIAKMPADDWRKRSPNFNEPRLSQIAGQPLAGCPDSPKSGSKSKSPCSAHGLFGWNPVCGYMASRKRGK
jgi:aryl-alcohol dehydrogenase-like predicted oxidoreductase